jgi:serine/threonine protein kinase
MVQQYLGGYEILEQVGQGGMATVYRAYDPRMGRDVAIKILHQTVLADMISVERFQREAMLIARLEHAHILPVYDFDSQHHPPYIVMRYMDGGTLDQLLARAPLSLERSVHLMKQICQAIDYGHRRGIIHRDIKPSNILLDREGNAYVTDFGIARITEQFMLNEEEDHATLTEIGYALGTPDYMSPEQARGEENIDHRTDIYSLGVMFFQMVAGEKPFKAKTAVEVIVKHIHHPVPSVRELRPHLPARLDLIITCAMSKQAIDRYRTASAFSDALDEIWGQSQQTQESPAYHEADSLYQMYQADPSPAPNPPTAENPLSQDKRVTIALFLNARPFLDLVTQQSNPSQAAKALRALAEATQALIEELGGQVILQDQNGQILAMWGLQVAQRSDAERAVEAAMRAGKALRQIGGGYFYDQPRLPMDAGINIGSVILHYSQQGDLTYNTTGETISLARRLAQESEGGILVAHEIFRHSRGRYDYEAGPSIVLRSDPQPHATYRVRERKHLRANFAATLTGSQNIRSTQVAEALAAASPEIANLVAVYHQAMSGQCKVVSIQGRHQGGRSKLLLEFYRWVASQAHQTLRWQGESTPAHQRQYPYPLLRSLVIDFLDLSPQDGEAIIQEKFEAGTASLLGRVDLKVAYFIAKLLGYHYPPPANLPPYAQETEALASVGRQSLIELITIAARRYGMILEIENSQWADEESLGLLWELTQVYPDTPLMIIRRKAPDESAAERSLMRRPDDEDTNSTLLAWNREKPGGGEENV